MCGRAVPFTSQEYKPRYGYGAVQNKETPWIELADQDGTPRIGHAYSSYTCTDVFWTPYSLETC